MRGIAALNVAAVAAAAAAAMTAHLGGGDMCYCCVTSGAMILPVVLATHTWVPPQKR